MKVAEAKEIFLEALERGAGEERRAYLDEVCGAEGGLRGEVEGLLAEHEHAGSFLGGASVRVRVGDGKAEGEGETIGRYKLLQKIGEGGFGEVYMAEQREPVKRRVALKVIKLGMDTRQVVARFEAERQALAMMDHPNIARVLDGGATKTGRPYFVMELVRGAPITQFCNEHKCTAEERLRLVIEVCEAIQHAHQKGIIHRDIKPTNVLVTSHDGRAVPKVIDFGVAKAMQQDLTDKTIFTRFQEFIGTPAYMSPEQAQMSGLDIDTRSDIYALGVLLYELLTGRPPFDSRELLEAGYDGMRKRIREEEPERPSTRVQTLSFEARTEVARQRNTNPERLRKALRGELDWIVLKCLEKDRSRRYESASALAHDLERYLRDEPVSAAAPSVWYKTRKFAARHRPVVVASGLLALLLVSGVLVSGYFAIKATQAERRARREAAIAEAVTKFLNEDFFGQADPAQEPSPELRVRTSLDRAASQIEHRFRGEPLVEAAVQATIGELYSKLSEYEAAQRHLNRAYELRFHELGQRSIETAEVMMDLAFVLLRVRRNDDARAMGEGALETARGLYGNADPRTTRFTARMAWVYYSVGAGPEARALAEEVLEIAKTRDDIPAIDLSQALQLVGRARGSSGDREGGEKMLREALALIAADQGATHPRTINTRNNLAAYFLDHNYNLEEAERLLLEAFEQHRRVFGESHYMTIQMRGNLVLLYRRLNRLGDALAQQFAMVELRGEKATGNDLDVLHWLLKSVPGKSLLGEHGARWRRTGSIPGAAWRFPDYDDSNWSTGAHGPGEYWQRRAFTMEKLPEAAPCLVIFGAGDFSAYLNGVPISSELFRKSRDFQIAILDREQMRALQKGRNVLAIHARPADGKGMEIDLLARPESSPEKRASDLDEAD